VAATLVTFEKVRYGEERDLIRHERTHPSSS
jgi:hypothetical protein